MAIPTILSSILLAPGSTGPPGEYFRKLRKGGAGLDRLDLPASAIVLGQRSDRSPAEEVSFIFPHPGKVFPERTNGRRPQKDGLGQRPPA